MKYKGVIFDLDGTLLDTLTDLFVAVNHTMAKLDQPLRNIDEVKSFIGSGVPTLLYRSLTNKDLVDEAVKIFTPFYDANKMAHTDAYEGVLLLLEELAKNNLKLGVVSNKVHDATASLNETIFKGLIKYVVGSTDEMPLKPDKSMMLKCLDMMKLSLGEVVYVGDTEVDYQTAKNIGVDFAAVTWGFRDRSFLEKLNPNIIVDTPKELLLVLLEERN